MFGRHRQHVAFLICFFLAFFAAPGAAPGITAGERPVKGPLIRGIRVRGNYPILSKNIKKLVPLQPGTVYDPSLIGESIENIKRYLTQHGYYGSRVTIAPVPLKRHEAIDLMIRLKRGRVYRLGRIFIEGNTVFRDSRIKNKFRHLGRFKPRRFRKDVKAVRKLYARKGCVKARVKVKDLTYHDHTGKVDIHLDIRENKRLKVILAGRPFFFPPRVKDVLNFEERRSYDRFAIKRGGYRLERYYRKRGFPNVVVTSEVIKPNDKEVIAKYTIRPGTRVELKEIRFTDNKSFGGKRLKKELISPESGLFSRGFFDERLLRHDRLTLLKFYKEHGFFDVTVGAPTIKTNEFGDQKTATFHIKEGPQYRFGTISITSDLPFASEGLLKKLPVKTGEPYLAKKIDEAKAKILQKVHKQGFAYAGVQVITTLSRETGNEVNVNFVIHRGHKAVVRSITIDGNLITKESTIRKNLRIKTGDPFVYQNMLDAQHNLRRLGIFSTVRITPIGFTEKSAHIDLAVTVHERKSTIVKLQGGFDSRHLVTGEFSFTKLNLFGTAKQLNLRAIGGPRFNRGEVTFFSPRIFGASWNLANQYFVQFEDAPNFDATSYGGSVNTLKNFGPHWTFGFKEQITRTELLESRSNVAALGNALFDNTFNEFQLTGLLDTRNNFSDPSRGFYILAQNEFNTDLASLANNFNTIKINASHYHGFLKRFTLVNIFRYGHILRLTSNPRIPANKLFFLGGADTIRGFPVDGVKPAGGTLMMVTNTELQYRVSGNIKIASFFDAGILTNGFNGVTAANIREAAGVGLRYFTPIGPLRLDWGFILDKRPGEPDSRVHFSFGYFF